MIQAHGFFFELTKGHHLEEEFIGGGSFMEGIIRRGEFPGRNFLWEELSVGGNFPWEGIFSANGGIIPVAGNCPGSFHSVFRWTQKSESFVSLIINLLV